MKRLSKMCMGVIFCLGLANAGLAAEASMDSKLFSCTDDTEIGQVYATISMHLKGTKVSYSVEILEVDDWKHYSYDCSGSLSGDGVLGCKNPSQEGGAVASVTVFAGSDAAAITFNQFPQNGDYALLPATLGCGEVTSF